MFRRRRRRSEPPDLRGMMLALRPDEAGVAPTSRHPRVWGAILETGLDNGWFTLVSLGDGTTSLYLSTGGGVIGAGEHERIAAASLAFLDAVEHHLDAYGPDTSDDPPARGRAILRALTFSGRLAAEAPEDDLGNDRHPLSPVFHAAHEVITLVRLASGG